jgi:hypothetical protein
MTRNEQQQRKDYNKMSKGVLRVSLMAGALVLGCAQSTEPVAEPPDAGLHFLTWDPANGPVTFSAVGETPTGALDIVHPLFLAAGDSIQLDTYVVSFWAVRGEPRSIQINYVNGTLVEGPYVRLDVSEPILRPDGSPIAVGDSILITVSVDPTDILVHLEPSGLQFGTANPTQLQMWYGGAKDDLNSDGTVNADDSYIQQTLLGMWYQEGADNPWDAITATHDLAAEWFQAGLQHFSGYAVSW